MSDLLGVFKPIDLLDIAIIAFVTYKIMVMLKGTRAVQLIKGIVLLLCMNIVSEFLGLTTVNWVLVQTQTVLLIAIPIVFQPELRRGLEQLGKSSLWNRTKGDKDLQAITHQVDQIVACVVAAAKVKTGVLIGIQRDIGLVEYTRTGIQIDGILSEQLLSNIFIVNTPLHDGAVIIDGEKILAASCFLPLSESQTISKELGTRHRAAIGLTEVTDAIAVTVSEETGAISIADNGILIRDLKEQKLRELLIRKLENQRPISNWRGKGGKHR